MSGSERRVRLGDVLGPLLSSLDRNGGLAAARAAEEWKEAAGPEIARHTAGVFLRGDELVVNVDSPVWATELSALGETLRQSLNARLGQELVRTIRFTVSRNVEAKRARERDEAKSVESYTEDVVEPVALSAAEVEQVRRSASVIRDEGLREAVIRATVKDLEWKRGMARREARSDEGEQGL